VSLSLSLSLLPLRRVAHGGGGDSDRTICCSKADTFGWLVGWLGAGGEQGGGQAGEGRVGSP